jgi:hypothetical protein
LTKKHMHLTNILDNPRQFFCRIQCPTHDLWKKKTRTKNNYPQKNQYEHFFRKTPGNFQWEVIPGGSGPYEHIQKKKNKYLKQYSLIFTIAHTETRHIQFLNTIIWFVACPLIMHPFHLQWWVNYCFLDTDIAYWFNKMNFEHEHMKAVIHLNPMFWYLFFSEWDCLSRRRSAYIHPPAGIYPPDLPLSLLRVWMQYLINL